MQAVLHRSEAAARAGGSGAASASGSEILIGATLPLTGAESRIGGFYKEGYELAFEEASQGGGISVGGKKMPVRLTLLDDTSSQATAASLADRLINSDKVQFLLGTYATNLVEAQSVVAEQNQIPYVNGGGAATAIYKRGYKWVFGLLAPVELLAESIMKWIDSEQQAGKVPSRRPSRCSGRTPRTARTSAKASPNSRTRASSYKVVVDESFELGGKDFSALLGQVKAAKTDLFLADAHLPDYITMQRQYVTAGLCNKVLSYGARGSEKQAAEALGKKNVEYVSRGLSSPLLRDKNQTKKFMDAFKAKYGGRMPEWSQALGVRRRARCSGRSRRRNTGPRRRAEKLSRAEDARSLLPGGEQPSRPVSASNRPAPFVVQQNMQTVMPVVGPRLRDRQGDAPNPGLRELDVDRLVDLVIAAVLLAGLYARQAYRPGLISASCGSST